MSGAVMTIHGTDFAVDTTRYEVKKFIGCGAYGVVCSAVDRKEKGHGGVRENSGERENSGVRENIGESKGTAAIKKMSGVFKSETTAKRSLREVRLLRHLNHENVLGLRDLMGPLDCSDLYVVTDLMDVDLGKVIRSPQPLSDRHVQFFLYQLLRGVRYLHACNVLHRDLKPCNILVNENCDLKISDFGLSRGVSDEEGGSDLMTEYVVTRWYRAPEIVLASEAYTKAVDTWSVGCVFAELLGRKPLFPGTDHVDQLRKTIDVIGTPSLDAGAMNHIPHRARRYLASMPQRKAKSFSAIYPEASDKAIALLNTLLCWEPSQRLTPHQALAHPYLALFFDPAVDADEPSTVPFFDPAVDADEPAPSRPRSRSPSPSPSRSSSPSPSDASDTPDTQWETSPSAAETREALFAELCRFRPELERQRQLQEESCQRPVAITPSTPITPAAATGTKRVRHPEAMLSADAHPDAHVDEHEDAVGHASGGERSTSRRRRVEPSPTNERSPEVSPEAE